MDCSSANVFLFRSSVSVAHDLKYYYIGIGLCTYTAAAMGLANVISTKLSRYNDNVNAF